MTSPFHGSFNGSRRDARQRSMLHGLIPWVLVVAGCDPTPSTRRDAGRDAATSDVPVSDAPTHDASVDVGGAEVDGGMLVTPAVEVCTNGIDEDRNGSIDDGCPCAVGTRRACWPGPPPMRLVGICSDGEQTCTSDGTASAWSLCTGSSMASYEIRDDGTDNDCDGETDEADAICQPREQQERTCDDGQDSDCDTAIDCDDPDCRMATACMRRCAPEETVCWGETDDDCDGRVDCADSECAGDSSCAPAPLCPPGQVRTFRQRNLAATSGGSGILPGDGAPITSAACEPGVCPAGQVRVVLASGASSCVPPPPECPSDLYANYRGYARWTCDPPCEIIVHYGHIYGGQRVCAGRPRITCPAGQSPTFRFETQSWICDRTCDNGLYDQIRFGGGIVCVPC